MYYGPVVMELVGLPRGESVELTALLACTQGAGLVIALWAYSALPRRQVLFQSIFGCIIGLLAISFAFSDIER